MLRSMQDLKNYTIGATDGEIGHVTDFFFDDEDWVIRYLVVETSSWLMTRKVLISPYSLLEADWLHKRLPVRINRDQVRNSPDIDTDKPVSRQQEMRYADFYGYPYYWGGMGGTTFWVDPAEQLVAVLMMQAPLQREYYRALMRNMVYAAITG